MSITSPTKPSLERHSSSYIPGGFETDNELDTSDVEGENTNPGSGRYPVVEDSLFAVPDGSNSNISQIHNDESSAHSSILVSNQHYRTDSLSHVEGQNFAGGHNTVLEEAEMNRKLDDFESSFIPELSHLSIHRPEPSHSDDSLFGVGREQHDAEIEKSQASINSRVPISDSGKSGDNLFVAQSPQTPPNHYRTPAPEQQDLRQENPRIAHPSSPEVPSTSRLEVMSSSPTAAKTVSRVQSMATIGGYETADDQDFPDSPTTKVTKDVEDLDATPRKDMPFSSSQSTISTAIRYNGTRESSSDVGSQSRRPKYLNSRSASSRLSYDSIASSTTETSDATLSADFALQSGGAVPEARLQRKPRMTLSRTTSLGSIVSGVSDVSDDERSTNRRAVAEVPDLSTLREETPTSSRTGRVSPNTATVVTPRPSNMNLAIPSDTVITNHVRDFEVPGTFAREYRQKQNPLTSPDKPIIMTTMTPSTKKGLTLKEHRSTVEKLGKENFDLKMKIHFLDQALQRRSEDGIKEMITENVQLKSDRMRIEKENHGLRKQVRELLKRLEHLGNGGKAEDQGYGTDEERSSPTAEEELLYLRERVEVNEIEISRLRKEGLERENEKRKLAEVVRSLGERSGPGSDVGSREERDMWKDMLEAETIAREQSEEECKKLREEMTKLRQETLGSNNKLLKGRIGGSVVSRSSSVEGSRVTRNDNAEVDRLRHEISELQKMIGAQASTLTSRNKEKERLYQEIEDLKIGRMGGLRSVAGDSILDRSASRARSNSRASNGTRFSRLSEPEREHFEARIGELRDEVSQLRLNNQTLQNQLEEALVELDAVDAQAQVDADQFNEELMLLSQERDNALRDADDQDQAFQQLKNEAQEEIDGLGDELDAKVEECERLEQELRSEAENVNALQVEMRSASEGLIRLEQDAQQNLARYQSVKAELDDAHRELDSFEKNLAEADSKIQRLTVQQESSHNEIAFLREEADSDKIKIGDLESLLKKVHLNLESERDRAKDLDRRLSEERQQKDAVSNQEKQEVQRMLDELNREASTAKDELRRAKKSLSSREIEATTYRERLTELEEGLRQILRDPNATRSSLVSTVTKMQRELDQATVDLEQTRQNLGEHQNLLSSRDVLLESSSLEYRKLLDVLERERQARRQDKHSFEQSLKSHQQSARALSANNARIAELEQQRQTHRKQMTQLETQLKEQLTERNQVLLTLWKKLSLLCGPDWSHNHSLINGNLPSQEVVGNVQFWPGFSHNLLLAAKQVEDTLASMKDKIKRVDRELWREYQNLAQTLEVRTKQLERIEESWEKMKLKQQEFEAGILPTSHSHQRQSSHASRNMSSSQQAGAPDTQRMRAENRLLKAELQLLQRQQSTKVAHERSHNRTDSYASALSGGGLSNDGTMSLDGAGSISGGGIPTRGASIHRHTVIRANSTGIVEHLSNAGDRTSKFHSGTGEAYSVSPERASLMISSKAITDSQSAISNAFSQHPMSSNMNQEVQTTSTDPVTSNFSDAGTVTTAALLGMGQERWIHRLRELERRLKAEREQRLIDRSGMRKRLEEREAVNESLRKELQRERVRRSWGDGDDVDPRLESNEPAIGVPSRGRDPGMGRISINNRIIDVGGGGSGGSSTGGRSTHEVEGSPVRISTGKGEGRAVR